MVVCRDAVDADYVRLHRGQGQDPHRRYHHVVCGFNYRMTNLVAALGLAQVERAGELFARRQEIAGWYAEELVDLEEVRLQPEAPGVTHARWMTAVVLDRPGIDRDEVMAALDARGIETRPFFAAMHRLPIYNELAEAGSLPVAERLADTGLCLPTAPSLGRAEVGRVVEQLRAALGRR